MKLLQHSNTGAGRFLWFNQGPQRAHYYDDQHSGGNSHGESAASVLLPTLSSCLQEPQARCRQYLKANALFLAEVEKFRNTRQHVKRLQQHVSNFNFRHAEDLARLDAADPRSRILVSYHFGDFIYGSNVFANHEPPGTAQFVLLQKSPGETFTDNMCSAFGESRFLSRTQILAEDFDLFSMRQQLKAAKSSLLTFVDLPRGFGRRTQVRFMGRKAWFPAGPAILGITGKLPLLPVQIFRDAGKHHILLNPLIESQKHPSESLEQAIRRITQQLVDPLQTLVRLFPEQWRYLSSLPSYFDGNS